MKHSKYIICIIAILLCSCFAKAQLNIKLQRAVDSLNISSLSLNPDNGWGMVPTNWKTQQRVRQLATDDDLAYIALNDKGSNARVFAYLVLLEKKSGRCFELLKKMIFDDELFSSHRNDVLGSDFVNYYVMKKSMKAGILDSTQIAYLDSCFIYSYESSRSNYKFTVLDRVVPQPQYYDVVRKIFNDGDNNMLPYIAMYKKQKDISTINKLLNEYKYTLRKKKENTEDDSYVVDEFMDDEEGYDYDAYDVEMAMQKAKDKSQKKLKKRKVDRSHFAIKAIAKWPHPAFVNTFEKYIKDVRIADTIHRGHWADIEMEALMSYNNDWSYNMLEQYLIHPLSHYYIYDFIPVYIKHPNKERFKPLAEKYELSTIVAIASQNTGNDTLYFSLDKVKKEASVQNKGLGIYDQSSKERYAGNIVIPSSIEYKGIQYTVTGIERHAFSRCDSLISVTLRNTINIIDAYTFDECKNLTSITLPSVKEIGGAAFENCINLKSVTISDSLSFINYHAFSGCESLSSFPLPQSLRKISHNVFSGCRSLKTITIPANLTDIDDHAFSGCYLTSIVVDKENPVYDSRNNCNAIIETATNRLIKGCSKTIIPDDIEVISSEAFSGCDDLKSIVIPESVKVIEEMAFSGCKGLTSITLPDSIHTIGTRAFLRCKNLKSINIPKALKRIEDNVFEECDSDISIVLHDSITFIGVGFPKYYDGPNIDIGKNINELPSFGRNSGANKFFSITVDKENKTFDSRNNCNAVIETATNTLLQGCSTTVIPDGVTSIARWAFCGLKSLKSIKIPESVVSIGGYAFAECDSLTSVTLPSTLKEIDRDVFYKCYNLHDIYNYSRTPIRIGKYIIPYQRLRSEEELNDPNSDDRVILHVPKGCKEIYTQAEHWRMLKIVDDLE